MQVLSPVAFLPGFGRRLCKNELSLLSPFTSTVAQGSARRSTPRRVAFGRPRAGPSYTRRERDAWPHEEIQVLPESLRPKSNETLDLILRAKVFLLQSANGYRANTDSLVLAYYAWQSFCEAQRQSSSRFGSFDHKPPQLMDIGAGNGLVSVLIGLAAAERKLAIVLVEKQPELACRARRNLALNGLSGSVLEHDVSNPLPQSFVNTACVVAMNPPFYQKNTRTPPRNAEKATAHIESTANLRQFLAQARDALQSGNGSVACMIHDMRQLGRIVLACDAVQMDVVEALEVMNSASVSTGRVLVKLRHALHSVDSEVKTAVKVGSLCLHPDSCERKRYFSEMEEFLSALPSPVWNIGRQDYFGSP